MPSQFSRIRKVRESKKCWGCGVSLVSRGRVKRNGRVRKCPPSCLRRVTERAIGSGAWMTINDVAREMRCDYREAHRLVMLGEMDNIDAPDIVGRLLIPRRALAEWFLHAKAGQYKLKNANRPPPVEHPSRPEYRDFCRQRNPFLPKERASATIYEWLMTTRR